MFNMIDNPNNQKAWATPSVAFFPGKEAASIEFLGVPGNGRLTARQYLDFCAHKNDLMDLASDSKRIVVAAPNLLVEEMSYVVNNLLCSILQVERSKITLSPTTGDPRIITLYFYQEEVAAARPAKTAQRKQHKPPTRHGHVRGHHSSPVHVF
jgi:hypothetical protein